MPETKRERALRHLKLLWPRFTIDPSNFNPPFMALHDIERLISLVRAEAFEESWDAISAMIKDGPLTEHRNHERNGLILAANAVVELKDKVERDEPR